LTPTTQPFERDDIPAAETVVDAPIDEVYSLLSDVQAWSGWIPEVHDPIHHDADSDVYRVAYAIGTETRQAELRRVLVGPSHRLSVEIVGRGVLHFRTRPQGNRTLLDARFQPYARATARIGRRRERARRTDSLVRLLDHARRHAEGRPPAES